MHQVASTRVDITVPVTMSDLLGGRMLYDIEEHAVVILWANEMEMSHITQLDDSQVLSLEVIQEIVDGLGLDMEVIEVGMLPQHGWVNGPVIPLNVHYRDVEPCKERG